MSTQTNAMPESSSAALPLAAAEIPVSQQMYWALRRELWENRAIYMAPLAAAIAFLLGYLVTTVHLAESVRAASALNEAGQREAAVLPYDMAASLLMGTFLFVAFYYCLESMQ